VVLVAFCSFVAFACVVALTDWRRAWLFACLVGVLQDPARKLISGQPVFVTFAIIAVYAMILFGSQRRMQAALGDFSRRFGNVWSAFGIVVVFLILAAINGVMTFGIGQWKAPMLSLFIYLAPLPAILVGYMYIDSEKRLYAFITFYCILTTIALVGTPLEYYRVNVPALGMVQQVGDYIRYLPGIELRMLSGFYRAPDIMGWHAAMLTSLSIGLIMHSGLSKRAWPWMLTAGWGFYCCMISGRRKAIYFVAAFIAAFLWRYFKRMKPSELGAFAAAGIILALVVHHISTDQSSSVYATAAFASSQEMTGRLEGGFFETVRQFGIMGAGLGIATQGVQHVISAENQLSWQEGGLGKLAVELGLPGLFAAAILAFIGLRTMMKITAIADQPWSSQISRVTLFAVVAANALNFLASAQTYSDPVITIITCFLVGALFATMTLDERTAAEQPQEQLVIAPITA
jgi:hypothetical protein